MGLVKRTDFVEMGGVWEGCALFGGQAGRGTDVDDGWVCVLEQMARKYGWRK